MNTKSQSENWISEARHRLANRRGKKPATKAAQIWALWSEIKGAIEEGQTMNSIRAWLEDDAGVVLTADSLRSYVRRCRAKEMELPEPETSKSVVPAPKAPLRGAAMPEPRDQANSDDPMATARAALSKPRFDIRKVHADGDPTDQNLI
ncbi:MAG TPA: hypothetical protein VFW94_14935 [Candidatus Acidoferrales bacterium]|nr:hypothetical protein [Candidatus Acidoferrales bacterium]